MVKMSGVKAPVDVVFEEYNMSDVGGVHPTHECPWALFPSHSSADDWVPPWVTVRYEDGTDGMLCEASGYVAAEPDEWEFMLFVPLDEWVEVHIQRERVITVISLTQTDEVPVPLPMRDPREVNDKPSLMPLIDQQWATDKSEAVLMAEDRIKRGLGRVEKEDHS